MNNSTHRTAIFGVAAFLTACASAPSQPLPRPPPDAQGEVIVFREQAFAAGGVGLTIGSGNKPFATLANSEKVSALFSVGRHEIYVQARSAEPTKVTVDVKKGALVCLRTSSSPSTYAKAVVPAVLILTGYHFYLDEVPCPRADELGKYRDVQVKYQ